MSNILPMRGNFDGRFTILLSLLFFTACGVVGASGNSIDPTTAPPAFWSNAPVDHLIAAWGEPDSSEIARDGGRHYTWTRRVGTSQIGSTYLGADGKVKKHPDLITSKLVVIKARADTEGRVVDFQASEAR